MVVKKLQEFLDTRNIKYDIISHSPSNTAQQTAASAHVHGKDLAKTVMVKADGAMTIAVKLQNRFYAVARDHGCDIDFTCKRRRIQELVS